MRKPQVQDESDGAGLTGLMGNLRKQMKTGRLLPVTMETDHNKGDLNGDCHLVMGPVASARAQ